MQNKRRSARRGIGMPEMILTPMIDTVLVLLVAFMMATPLMHNYITVELPTGSSHDTTVDEAQKDSITVSLDKDKHLFINDVKVSNEQFFNELEKKIAGQQDRVVFVHADSSIPYGNVIRVVDDIKYLAGVKYVALATEHMA